MLVAVERERGPAREDDIKLVVTVLLAVLLDDPLSGLVGRVRIDAERPDVEVPSHRAPVQTLLPGDWERLQVVDPRHRVSRLRHVCLLSSSSTTGSTRSAPSTRSSRFSFPAHVLKDASRSPSKPSLPRRSRSSSASASSTSSHSSGGVLPKIAWCMP